MSVGRILTWGAGLGSGAALGLFYTGHWGYGFSHSPQWIERNMQKLPQVKDLDKKGSEFDQTRPWETVAGAHMPSHAFNVKGGVSPPVVYTEKADPAHTVTFTYVGGKTCGYPFIVHGGVLGTLLEDAFTTAAVNTKTPDWRKLEIVYRKPTFSGQFLVIETHRVLDGKFEAVIYNADGKRLVQAVAV